MTIMELADAYARETYPALITEARAALVAEVEKLEAAFNDRVRVIEMQLQDKEALQAEVDEQREDYLAKCSELEAVHEHYRIITVKLQAELEAARKDAARYHAIRDGLEVDPNSGIVVSLVDDFGGKTLHGEQADAAIDAATEATK